MNVVSDRGAKPLFEMVVPTARQRGVPPKTGTVYPTQVPAIKTGL